MANTTKDRTQLFDGMYFKPGIDTGKKFLEWLESGAELVKTETTMKINTKWIDLGMAPDKLEAQVKKLYGSTFSNLSETQAQDFLAKLTESLKAKQEQAATTIPEGA
jgi:hypothetical protein